MLDAYQSRRSFKGAIKQHGVNYKDHLKEFINTKPKDNEEERAIVAFINEEIQAVGIVTQKGVRLFLKKIFYGR